MPQNRLKELREENGLSQADLGAKVGKDASTISRWETGASFIPDPLKQELAEIFAVSVPHLMGWDEPNGNGDNGVEVAA